ncbi:hypothetical protein POM88_027556 [Heracleum sosnowskyi]|uniref:Uncharacterized protein n=1 Tax=Heracleum sosnowskyi TaxID=360622 RepID=A0AAD8I7U7_9APIA|nr:hypothetical protein POM88_027469 [Heracleum sosnowskyi]KAK1380812.1 hypothetical protein POM88_027556 [Heracleum sosnowskyi]
MLGHILQALRLEGVYKFIFADHVGAVGTQGCWFTFELLTPDPSSTWLSTTHLDIYTELLSSLDVALLSREHLAKRFIASESGVYYDPSSIVISKTGVILQHNATSLFQAYGAEDGAGVCCEVYPVSNMSFLLLQATYEELKRVTVFCDAVRNELYRQFKVKLQETYGKRRESVMSFR